MNQDRDLDELPDAMAHLIIECGVVPGVSSSCRCYQCRQVAKAMDDAGYLDYVKDRWWETDARS